MKNCKMAFDLSQRLIDHRMCKVLVCASVFSVCTLRSQKYARFLDIYWGPNWRQSVKSDQHAPTLFCAVPISRLRNDFLPLCLLQRTVTSWSPSFNPRATRRHLYCHQHGTNLIVKFHLKRYEIIADLPLPGAGYSNQFPYTSGENTDIDMAVDELGV